MFAVYAVHKFLYVYKRLEQAKRSNREAGILPQAHFKALGFSGLSVSRIDWRVSLGKQGSDKIIVIEPLKAVHDMKPCLPYQYTPRQTYTLNSTCNP